ncbi:hypothetical protein [Streptomyces sp. NPDC056264]
MPDFMWWGLFTLLLTFWAGYMTARYLVPEVRRIYRQLRYFRRLPK